MARIVTEAEIAEFLARLPSRAWGFPVAETRELLHAAGFTLTAKNRQLRDAAIRAEAASTQAAGVGRRVSGNPLDALRFIDPAVLADAAGGASRRLLAEANRRQAETEEVLRTLDAALAEACRTRPDVPEFATLQHLVNALQEKALETEE